MLYDKQKAIAYKKVLLGELDNLDSGYCVHGTFIGGILADYSCGYCEEGDTASSAKVAYSLAIAKAKAQKAEELVFVIQTILDSSTSGLALRRIAKLLKDNQVA